MSQVYSLAFWFVLIGTVLADFKKCSDALKNKAFDGPDNNVLLKLFKESQLEDEELKQFVCDLSEHQIVIGTAFDDQAQGLPSPLKEEYTFLKSLDQFDKPMAKLLHKLHKSMTNEKCNYKKNQHKKRMLQLMMDLSNDGSGGLADLNSAKKRQQRRRGRRKIPIHISTTNKIAIICVLLMIVCIFNIAMFCWYNNCYDCCCCSSCCCPNDLEIGMPMHIAELADNQGFDGSAQNTLKSTDYNLTTEGLPADHIKQGTGPEAAAATIVHVKSQAHEAEEMPPAPALSAEHEHVPSYRPGDNMATNHASETVANGGTGAAFSDPPSP
uniref:Uncharacterized protein n=1 Tax=Globodera pallida TaxID=36090 RepID=A0A183C5C6_GLOPA